MQKLTAYDLDQSISGGYSSSDPFHSAEDSVVMDDNTLIITMEDGKKYKLTIHEL